MVKARYDHLHEAESPIGGDVISADAADGQSVASDWTAAFIAEREDMLADTMLDDVLAAARDADVDENEVRRALRTMGLRTRRDGTLGRRKARPRNGDASSAPEEPRSERPSNRAPGGKVRIIAVDLDTDGDVTDHPERTSIVARIRCDQPGRLHARVLVRVGERAEVEAVAPVRELTDPGVFAMRCDIPADALGALRHAVDVEAWLDTASASYASMLTHAQRFRSRERGASRGFVRLDARWSEDPL